MAVWETDSLNGDATGGGIKNGDGVAYKKQCLESFYSEVIPRRLFFGGFPRQGHLLKWKEKIRSWGLNTMTLIDLTTVDEKQQYDLYPYINNMIHKSTMSSHQHYENGTLTAFENTGGGGAFGIAYLNYPIADNSIPADVLGFLRFLSWLKIHYESASGPIIIHCKGGHGRSAMMTICLLHLLCDEETVTISDIMDRITQLHHTRPGLHHRYYHQLCPVSSHQRKFLSSLEQFDLSSLRMIVPPPAQHHSFLFFSIE